jgi:hypothetical protein
MALIIMVSYHIFFSPKKLRTEQLGWRRLITYLKYCADQGIIHFDFYKQMAIIRFFIEKFSEQMQVENKNQIGRRCSKLKPQC